MSKIGFYRQERLDGGVRTGIEINGEIALGRFESTGDDHDPALAWYVDVTCEGASLPDDPEPARQWLCTHSQVIRGGLKEMADTLRAGIDADSWPVKRKLSKAPRNVRITIACSAVRRWAAREMARVLRDIADKWEDRLRGLAPLQTTSV